MLAANAVVWLNAELLRLPYAPPSFPQPAMQPTGFLFRTHNHHDHREYHHRFPHPQRAMSSLLLCAQ